MAVAAGVGDSGAVWFALMMAYSPLRKMDRVQKNPAVETGAGAGVLTSKSAHSESCDGDSPVDAKAGLE